MQCLMNVFQYTFILKINLNIFYFSNFKICRCNTYEGEEFEEYFSYKKKYLKFCTFLNNVMCKMCKVKRQGREGVLVKLKGPILS